VAAGRERYTVVLEALPDSAPPAVRLRHLLKSALRAWRLRCIEVSPAVAEAEDRPAEQPPTTEG
jgi:hypothetical protein